jgi:UDP-N-acetyl-D-mannosaminuronate dehydrogenase
MPGYVTARATELLNSRSKALNGSQVLLVGVTYKKDIADQRETPATAVARKLRAQGAALAYHDPYVIEWEVDGQPVRHATDLDAELAAADLTILLQQHSAYNLESMVQMSTLLLDTCGHARGENVETL